MTERITRTMHVKEGAEQKIEIPVIRINGHGEGPTLAVVAGVHGSEFVGIEAAIRLGNTIDPQNLKGNLIIVTIANLTGFLARSMHICPVDDKNMGGLFPGDPSGSFSQALACEVFSLIKEADFVIDLHGGDLEEELTAYSSWPETGNEKVDSTSRALAEAFDMPFILKKSKPKDKTFVQGGLYNAAAEAGIPGMLAEAGSHGELDLNLVEDVQYRGIINVMRYTNMIEGEVDKRYEAVELTDFVGVYASQRGIFYPVVKAGEIIRQGALMGTLKDFWGQEVEKVYSPVNSCVLGVITTPSMDQGHMIAGLGPLA